MHHHIAVEIDSLCTCVLFCMSEQGEVGGLPKGKHEHGLGCRNPCLILQASKHKATNLAVSALSWQGVAYIFKC